jgi:hypothetical protein
MPAPSPSGRRSPETRAGSAPLGSTRALAPLAGADCEHELKPAIVDGLAHCEQPDGSYCRSNGYHHSIARV